jgi:hypothetical protein
MKLQKSENTVRTFVVASFLNDFGSDMIYQIWPLFVTTALGANMTILGLIDDLGEAFMPIAKAVSFFKIKETKPSDRKLFTRLCMKDFDNNFKLFIVVNSLFCARFIQLFIIPSFTQIKQVFMDFTRTFWNRSKKHLYQACTGSYRSTALGVLQMLLAFVKEKPSQTFCENFSLN